MRKFGDAIDITDGGEKHMKFPMFSGRYLLYVLGAIVLLIIFLGSWTIIPAGHRGVIFNQITGVQDGILGEGFHFKTPLLDKIIEMDIRTDKIEVEVAAASKDLQTVEAIIALNYHPQANSLNKLYQTIGTDYQYRVIDPAIQESVKSVTARFTAEDLIGKRSEVRTQIKQELSDRLKKYFVEVDDFNVVNFEFSEEFDRAVEAKVTAEQDALRAQRDLERIKIEAEQKIAQAQAEAESIRIQQQQLQNNPEILRLRAIEKWDGRLPSVMGAGPTPFIDVTDIIVEE